MRNIQYIRSLGEFRLFVQGFENSNVIKKDLAAYPMKRKCVIIKKNIIYIRYSNILPQLKKLTITCFIFKSFYILKGNI